MIIDSTPPRILGQFKITPSEMMFVQYLPVRMPRVGWRIPPNMRCFKPLLDVADMDVADDDYVYLTARHLWVTPENMGNRPGWHADGFGTEDLNYIWSDRAPTEFAIQRFDVREGCEESMADMASQALPSCIETYGENTILMLRANNVHQVPIYTTWPGYRTFVKISVSKARYNLAGNAHNYMFDYVWDMVPRGASRNHPSQP